MSLLKELANAADEDVMCYIGAADWANGQAVYYTYDTQSKFLSAWKKLVEYAEHDERSAKRRNLFKGATGHMHAESGIEPAWNELKALTSLDKISDRCGEISARGGDGNIEIFEGSPPSSEEFDDEVVVDDEDEDSKDLKSYMKVTEVDGEMHAMTPEHMEIIIWAEGK